MTVASCNPQSVLFSGGVIRMINHQSALHFEHYLRNTSASALLDTNDPAHA